VLVNFLRCLFWREKELSSLLWRGSKEETVLMGKAGHRPHAARRDHQRNPIGGADLTDALKLCRIAQDLTLLWKQQDDWS
jgi:hypothetical protein